MNIDLKKTFIAFSSEQEFIKIVTFLESNNIFNGLRKQDLKQLRQEEGFLLYNMVDNYPFVGFFITNKNEIFYDCFPRENYSLINGEKITLEEFKKVFKLSNWQKVNW